MKRLIVLWVGTILVLCVRIWHYTSTASQFAPFTDARSIERYNAADDMAALYLVVLGVVMFLGVVAVASIAGMQAYREYHPKRRVFKGAEYWDKVVWCWLVGYFLALVTSCVTMTWNLPLGVLGLVPTGYLFCRGLACLALSNEFKQARLAPGAYSPRRHPI